MSPANMQVNFVFGGRLERSSESLTQIITV